MTTEELNQAIIFLREKGIRVIFSHSKWGILNQSEINRFHEDHKQMKVFAEWGSMDATGNIPVWNVEHPNENDYKEIF